MSQGGNHVIHPALDTFTCFADLPTELRLRVWEYLIQPRIIIAACLEADEASLHKKRTQLASRARRPAVPVLLHVNREARELGLKHYALTFAWKTPPMLVTPPVECGPRVYFNFAADALFLLGDLEPYDGDGFNRPMVYFLRREDTRRVRHIACAFEELHYPELESEQIFGCLFHIVDRFPGAQRLLITSTPQDLEAANPVRRLPSTDNIIQKIWHGWIGGTSIVTSSLANTQILMVGEDGLADFIAAHS